MACLQSLTIPWTTLWTKKGSNNVYIVGTGYVSTAGWSKVRGQLELRAFSGAINVGLGYETSVDQLAADAPAQVGTTYKSTEGVHVIDWESLATAIAAKPWIRFGFMVRNNGADVSLELARGWARLDFTS